MRPRLTPWYAFGVGWQRTLRRPYLDADVQPAPEGCWVYRLTLADGTSVELGVRPSRLEAMAAATSRMLDEHTRTQQAAP